MRKEISITIVDYKFVKLDGSLSHLEVLVAYQPISKFVTIFSIFFQIRPRLCLFFLLYDVTTLVFTGYTN